MYASSSDSVDAPLGEGAAMIAFRALSAAMIAAASPVMTSWSLPPMSFSLDLCFADHVLPLLELVANPPVKFGGGRGCGLRALQEQFLLHVGQRKHLDECGLQLGDD